MSVLPRTPEPEVMDSEAEARDYDAMDHREVNASFCGDLLAIRPHPRRVLDAGTGTALIAIELCRRAAQASVEGIDLAGHMLALARTNVQRAGMEGRVRLAALDAKATPWPARAFDTVMSNSLVHHMPDPAALFAEMWRLVGDGGLLFVRDLARPDDAARAESLADRYASTPEGASTEQRAMHDRQRALFVASLHAALTVDEVRAMTAPLGIPGAAVRATSDRHWTLAHVRS
ncbi:MAG TPA: class I SAM-dependent methyltransferase [Polyangiaceae bacterium]|jgi:ubiquinone/menaquinone biosynthesis C-methylase UbiE|nr:class I SAM-dependent methyltransferase [Polyangiaceae bacterium]